MNLVLDASLALSWVIPSEGDAFTTRVLERLESEEAVVPALWFYEMANGLLVAERRARLSSAACEAALNFLEELPIRPDPAPARDGAGSLVQLARAYRLTAYDAAYLELALRRSVPLLTLDLALRRAAQQCGLATELI